MFFPANFVDTDGVGGGAVEDPVTLYVGIPLSESGDDCMYTVSLEGVVDDVIERWSGIERIIVDKDGQGAARRIAQRLRELAEKLERACGSV
jgi:hypothetical protein